MYINFSFNLDNVYKVSSSSKIYAFFLFLLIKAKQKIYNKKNAQFSSGFNCIQYIRFKDTRENNLKQVNIYISSFGDFEELYLRKFRYFLWKSYIADIL